MSLATLDNDNMIIRAGWATSSSTCSWSSTSFSYQTLGTIKGDKIDHTFGMRLYNSKFKMNCKTLLLAKPPVDGF